MESIIEFIFDNLFFVLIVVFGLINLLGRSKNEEEQKGKQPQRRPVPAQRQETPTHKREVPQPTINRQPEPKQTQTKVEELFTDTQFDSTSIEDQRQEQFDRLRRQFQTSHTQDDINRAEKFTFNESESEINTELQRENIQTNLNQRLTQKGLIESVIMAEVLGPPKARKRMSNRYNQR